MKFSNLLKSIVTITVVSFIVISCSDDMNLTPLDAPSSETFFTNQSELELAINGVYNSTFHWSVAGTPWILALELTTDNGFARSYGMNSVPEGGAGASTGVFGSYWSNFYTAIGRANNLLDNMSRAEETVSADFMQRVEAEARFLRAYSYHHLSELYGDVPLLLEVPAPDETQIGRTAKAGVVDQILDDLDFAAQNLPNSWSGSDEGRATSDAATALKARVALYNERYQIASQAASQVIESGQYSLHPDYEEVFKLGGQRNSGVIFDVPYLVGVETHNTPRRHGSRMVGAWSQNVPSQFLVDSYQVVDGQHIDESQMYDPAQPFENRDPRLDASIVRPQSMLANIVYETHPDSIETWRIENGDSVRVDNQDALNPFASFTGYLFRKYTNPDEFGARMDDSEQNIILIRLAEMYLVYAEAKIESNDIDQSVLDAMNQVRARGYGVEPTEINEYPAITTTDQAELRRELRYERKIELAVEGFRLFDIRRWGVADEVMDGSLIGRPTGAYSTISSPPSINRDMGHHPDYGATQNLYRNVQLRSFNSNRDFLWPIPQAEMDVNDSITQNPGY